MLQSLLHILIGVNFGLFIKPWLDHWQVRRCRWYRVTRALLQSSNSSDDSPTLKLAPGVVVANLTTASNSGLTDIITATPSPSILLADGTTAPGPSRVTGSTVLPIRISPSSISPGPVRGLPLYTGSTLIGSVTNTSLTLAPGPASSRGIGKNMLLLYHSISNSTSE